MSSSGDSSEEAGSHAVHHYWVHKEMKGVYDDVCWVYYALFAGWGFTKRFCDPCLLNQSKLCCIEESVQSTDCCGEEGWCWGVKKNLCVVTMAHLPGQRPDFGFPLCALCNMRCGGDEPEESKGDPDDDEVKAIVQDTFICWFCICEGMGVVCGEHPLCYGDGKLCCIRSHLQTGECNDPDTGCCYHHQKFGCIAQAGACPPGGGKHDSIPMCAFCGMKCGGEDEDGNTRGIMEEAPEQEDMS